MSDLSIEFGCQQTEVEEKVFTDGSTEVTLMDLSNLLVAKQYNRKRGKYYTLNNCSDCNIVAKYIRKLMPDNCHKPLVIGLGNPQYIADSFGTAVLDEIVIGQNGKKSNFCKFYPLVSGTTGIESVDIIKILIEHFTFDVVIAIDTLATRSADRIGKLFQITDAGITPGAGAGTPREMLSAESLGVPIIAVGVPLVIKLPSLVNGISSGLFAPACIDKTIKYSAIIVGKGINIALTE